MRNKSIVTGSQFLGKLKIDTIISEPCFRLSQYGMGIEINCTCSVCTKRGQTPSEAKAHMDKIYKNLL